MTADMTTNQAGQQLLPEHQASYLDWPFFEARHKQLQQQLDMWAAQHLPPHHATGVEQACRELDWFPTPRQCLHYLNQYNPAPTIRDRALSKCQHFTQSKFEEWLSELRWSEVEQCQIDDKPERWRRIAEVQMLLRRTESGGYVQRVKA